VSRVRPAFFFALAPWLAALVCAAQDLTPEQRLADGVAAAQQDVREATEALNALRDRTAAERRPLAVELEALQNETLELRREAERLRNVRRQGGLAREALQRDLAQVRDEHTFVRTLLQEYRRSFETRLGVAESQVIETRLATVDAGLGGAVPPDDFLSSVDALLRLAEDWSREKLGGARHPGLCLDGEGGEHAGAFAVMGPLSYFSTDSGAAAGIVVRRLGSARPSLFRELDPRYTVPIAALVSGSESTVPVDVTGGDALKVAAARTASLRDHLVSGGFVMVPLLLIGLLAALLAVWKVISLGKIRTPPDAVLDNVAQRVREGRTEEAQALVDAIAPPFRSVLQTGIDHRELRRDHLEEILHERALATLPALDRHLGMLAVLGGVAPLLGLLGTVTGMIHTFELVTLFGTGDAKLLSGGISEALVTTETGLVIAVPVLLVHAYLTRRARSIVARLEQMVVGYLNRLHTGDAA